MFWGLSESLDLYQEYLNAQKKQQSKEAEADQKNDNIEATNNEAVNEEQPSSDDHSPSEAPKCLNVLIFGASDPRHVIKTLAKLYTHRTDAGGDGGAEASATPHINFYILDGCVEIVARNLALLGIALEHAASFNLLSKVHLFMDVYGNTLLRPFSHQYLVGKSKALLRMVTDEAELQRLAPLLCLEDLKYRERDGLENAINFWLPKEGYVFNVQEHWEARLRKLLGQRYDYRDGAFDWDLNMTLKEREAQQLCSQEYGYWRETGIAFTFPEYEQCKPNKTLVVGLVRNGEKYLHRGYMGDIETGPYCAYGLKTSDGRMMRSAHGANDYRATDVSERNLLELFHELQTRTAYEHDPELSRKYGSVKLLMGQRLTCNECDEDATQTYDKSWLPVAGVRLHFLSADEVFTLQDAEGRWRKHFDVAFVGHNYFAFLKESFVQVLRENALLLLETKLLTVARKDAVNGFETKLMNFAKNAKLQPVLNYGALNAKHSLLKFRRVNVEE